MSHKEQRNFLNRLRLQYPERFNNPATILEVGSQNINGSVRDLFCSQGEYLGIDLGMAPDVDWTIPGELIELPNAWADIVISTECFEHCQDWVKVFINMMRISKPSGLVIVTCASIGRAAHGTVDSDEDSSPFTTNYYKNLGVDDISEKIKIGLYFGAHGFEVNNLSNDLYFWGIRSDSEIHEGDDYWEAPMSRLARAQGQLAQAASRQTALQADLHQAKAEADQAKAEADQAKAEADQAKAEAVQAKSESTQNNKQRKEIENSKFWRVTSPARKSIDRIKRYFMESSSGYIH